MSDSMSFKPKRIEVVASKDSTIGHIEQNKPLKQSRESMSIPAGEECNGKGAQSPSI